MVITHIYILQILIKIITMENNLIKKLETESEDVIELGLKMVMKEIEIMTNMMKDMNKQDIKS